MNRLSLSILLLACLSIVLIVTAAGSPVGAGSTMALETAGGEQRMLFVNGGAAPAP